MHDVLRYKSVLDAQLQYLEKKHPHCLLASHHSYLISPVAEGEAVSTSEEAPTMQSLREGKLFPGILSHNQLGLAPLLNHHFAVADFFRL